MVLYKVEFEDWGWKSLIGQLEGYMDMLVEKNKKLEDEKHEPGISETTKELIEMTIDMNTHLIKLIGSYLNEIRDQLKKQEMKFD